MFLFIVDRLYLVVSLKRGLMGSKIGRHQIETFQHLGKSKLAAPSLQKTLIPRLADK